ncbi:MAG: DUF1816 domain-containing protein [Hormoscilla sp. SP5CHS1]|nr:DUF1816 domain-containing protein [Hormoscilla sp. SP5CHS1]MBC6475779.1 DUF1816 domain-containing protein [Hormoscilla sp. GM102CHS1]
MKELMISSLNALGLAWWVEIVTDTPRCTYYFGPFTNKNEAEVAQSGYIEDLEKEGAIGITVVVKRCKPINLTIFEEWVGELTAPAARTPFLNGQM